jgi:hypothetical protein
MQTTSARIAIDPGRHSLAMGSAFMVDDPEWSKPQRPPDPPWEPQPGHNGVV